VSCTASVAAVEDALLLALVVATADEASVVSCTFDGACTMLNCTVGLCVHISLCKAQCESSNGKTLLVR
jgi:hypothetical protein